MKTTPAIEVIRHRFKAFLSFLRQKMILSGSELDRLAQFRRVSDLRVRQYMVGKARVTVPDLCRLLHDGKAERFDEQAVKEGLIQPGHLTAVIGPLGEEMGYMIEACLSHQILGHERMEGLLKAFFRQHGKAPEPTPAESRMAPRAGGSAPLPAVVQKLLGKVGDLWSMPAVARKALEMLEIPETPVETVTREIEKDPGLSAMCLKIINSAYYGMGSKIASIKLAIVMLGYPVTRQIVSVSALATRLGKRHSEFEFDLNDFWSHSLCVGHASSLLAKAMRLGQPDEYFSSGLIHDIGKLVEYQYLRAPMKQILQAVREGAPYPEAEQKVLGINHSEIGACLCERWNFPPVIVDSVRHHLDTREALEETELPREAMVVAAMCRLSRDGVPPSEVQAWTEFLGAPAERVNEIREKALELSRGCLTDIFQTA